MIISSLNSKTVKLAKDFAIKAHSAVGQKYGEFPYSVHLQAVESVALRFDIHVPDVLAGCWLHDVLEDTATTVHDLSPFFSVNIIDMVSALSETKFGNRQQRHAITYPVIAKNHWSVLIKLCDRIANVEAGNKNDMYRKEHGEFKRYFRNVDLMKWQEVGESMWVYLDSLLI